MKLNELFKQVDLINKMLDGQLLEISVRQHQITLVLKEPFIYLSNVFNLLGKIDVQNDGSFISSKDDVMYLVIGNLNFQEMEQQTLFYVFMKVISEMAEKVCTCPSLEYVVSEQYIKCFLDKPGLDIETLSKYEEVLHAKGKSELELHPQRPYLLFINEDWEE